MKIVITGATGYIGKKLICALKMKGHQLAAVVRTSSDVSDVTKYVEVILNVEVLDELYESIRSWKPDVFINLAGYYCAVHQRTTINALLKGNIELPLYVADAVVSAGSCRGIIHTASMQQMQNGVRYEPLNLYAATKQATEDILYHYAISDNVSLLTLQLFDTYGEDDTRKKVFNLVRQMHAGETLALSKGEQRMYFCYIDDVVDAYLRALEILAEMQPGSVCKYSVRPDEAISLRDFVDLYIEMRRISLNLEWGARDYMKREIMNPDGYGEVLPGWRAKISYEEGMTRCVKNDEMACGGKCDA